MSLKSRIKDSVSLSPQEKLILGLISNHAMTMRQIIDCVMSEPYELDFKEARKALIHLNERGLLELHKHFLVDSMSIEPLLTFSGSWVTRL